MTNAVKFHPLADMFPLMEGQEFAALVADIKANGLNEDIITYQGMILDGRNRYRACLAAGWHPVTIAEHFVVGAPMLNADRWIDDPAAYVISANIRRRHLTPAQKQKVLAKLVAAQPEKSDRELAKQAGVSHPTIAKARRAAEATGKALPVDKRVGADGKARKQPARKKRKCDDGSAEFTWANDEESRERMAAWTEQFVCKLIALDRQNAHELLNLLWIANRLRARSRLLDRLQKSLERGLPEVHPTIIDQDGNVLAGTQRFTAAPPAGDDDGLDIPARLRRAAP